MVKIKKNIKTAYDRKKSYENKGRGHREFKVGENVFLRKKGVH